MSLYSSFTWLFYPHAVHASFKGVILRSSWRGSIRRSTTGGLPSLSAGDFDQKIKAKMAFYMRFSWKSRVYKAVFWVNIVRTRDIVLLPIEPLPEVSHRVWFLFMCHVKGCAPSAVFGDCSVTSKLFLRNFTFFGWFSRFLQAEWKKKILGALLNLNEHMDALWASKAAVAARRTGFCKKVQSHTKP